MANTKLKYTHRIDTAHRLFGYKGKCQQIHGHSYKVTFTVEGSCLDECGMLVDFGEVKSLLGGWLDSCWDHRLLLNEEDPIINILAPVARAIGLQAVSFNPTAENMAAYLLDMFSGDIFLTGASVVEVEVEETPTSRAIATEGACVKDC